MASAKFITIFTVVTSLIIVMFATQVCGGWADAIQDNPSSFPVLVLYDVNNYESAAATCTYGSEQEIADGQIAMTSNFTNATSDLVTLSSGATGSFGISSFVDVIKLIVGVVGLILGLPLYTFLFNIGLNTTVATLLTTFLGLFHILGIVEFIRGGSL